jgi:hypothetical protein
VFTTNKKEIKIIYIFLKHKKTLLKLQSNAQAIQRKGGTKHKHICEAGKGKNSQRKKQQLNHIEKQTKIAELIQQKHNLALHKNKDFPKNKQPGKEKAAAHQHSSHPETDPDQNQNRRQKLPHQSQHCYMSRNKFGSAHHFVQEAWGEI